MSEPTSHDNEGRRDRRDDRRSSRRRSRDNDYDDDWRDDNRVRRRDTRDDPSMRFVMPIGCSGWAIASGYLGLVSVLFIPAPFALLTGILAIRDIRRNPKKHGMGRAVFGIVMGGMITTVMLAFLVIALVHGIK